ncbi:DUF1045 domain-containing protein [Roseibium salinum]|uniref:DUF1045 domain-containing protein n=1 Tax=Roseibium salinum TaxID=1604349 RepID=A0ABT3R7H7_9HYPH|nr:DUF1045 domain-containing protein [Roseibium sp. DSM 29163]MCX2724987.1 DUF1045 domain-containing protein [Roseibium sp. DSM 29163]
MRYAIYFAADADDRLMQLGNAWLGRDPFRGTDLRQAAMPGLTAAQVQSLTSSPRRYGFHGTLKAPFTLRAGEREQALLEACEAFAGEIAPFNIEGLDVNRLGKFLALTPNQPEAALNGFAALCVRSFEPFRAPLTEADLERRRRSGLTPRQDLYVTEWGYPYVFDEFRFHMTLSNKLEDEAQAGLLADAARTFFAEVTGHPRRCGSFGLYVEPEAGAPFDVHTVFRLTGTTAPLEAAPDAGRLTRKETL